MSGVTGKRAYNGRMVVDHLPKTAGQAVHAWLTAALGPGCVSRLLNISHRPLIRQYGGDYSILYAHTDFFGEGLDPRYQYVTCVREPLDRAVSWLYFVVNNHDANDLGSLRTHALRFLETQGAELHPDLKPQLCNPYVEHFCTVDHRRPDLQVKLAAALNALNAYEVCGLFEDLPSYVAQLADLIGIQTPLDVAQVNVTRKRPAPGDLPSATRRRLEALLELDMALYEAVRKRRRPTPQVSWPARAMGRLRNATGSNGTRKAGNRPALPETPRASWLPYARRASPDFCDAEFQLLDVGPAPVGDLICGTSVNFSARFSLARPVDGLVVGMHILDENGRWASGTNTELQGEAPLFAEKGNYRVDCNLVANLPDGHYVAGLAFIDGPVRERRELGWFHELLRFDVAAPRKHASVGYADLKPRITLQRLPGDAVSLVDDACGSLIVEPGVAEVPAGAEFILAAHLRNASTQAWVSTQRNPIHLTYRWLDNLQAAPSEEGIRTPLPGGVLAAKADVGAPLRVRAPAHPGRHRLRLLVVQEGHCWFDARGLKCAEVDILVVPQQGAPAAEIA